MYCPVELNVKRNGAVDGELLSNPVWYLLDARGWSRRFLMLLHRRAGTNRPRSGDPAARSLSLRAELKCQHQHCVPYGLWHLSSAASASRFSVLLWARSGTDVAAAIAALSQTKEPMI